MDEQVDQRSINRAGKNTVFRIRRAEKKDLEQILFMIETAVKTVTHAEWFVPDDRNYLERHLETDGFLLIAETEDNKAAAYFMVDFPDLSERNLGYFLNLSYGELSKVAHMDSVSVFPQYRGNGLQGKLLEAAEQELQGGGRHHLMATVHPENQYSLNHFLNRGYRILTTVKKYGNLDRHILYKNLVRDDNSGNN